MLQKNWWKFIIKIDHNFEDIVSWKLENAGIYSFAFNYLDIKSSLIELVVWLPKKKWGNSERKNFEVFLADIFERNGYEFNGFQWSSLLEDQWSSCWKKYWEPELIGNDFLVLPCWMKLPKQYKSKIIIKIDPGAAFGTGSHPSTSLCLEMMESIQLVNKKVLDIGCGTGILTVSAKKLGASEVHSLDKDYLSIDTTKDNINSNFGCMHDFYLHEGSFSEIEKKKLLKNFDVIFCNILANVIKNIIPYFSSILNSKGIVIISGIVSDQKNEIVGMLNSYHFKIYKILSKEDWICIKAIK